MISVAQDQKAKWTDLVFYLGGEFNNLTHLRDNDIGKIAYRFVIVQDDLRCYLG